MECEVGAGGAPIKQELDIEYDREPRTMPQFEEGNYPADDVSIKSEIGADGTPIKQELEEDPLMIGPWTVSPSEEADVPIECEVGAGGILIKQELDIEYDPEPRATTQFEETAPSTCRQPPSANARRTPTPLHCGRESTQVPITPSSKSVTSERAGPSECSSVSDVGHGLSNEATSTTHALYRQDCVTLGDRTSERMYKCDHCMYSTSRRNYFIMHVRTHTRGKPYKCEHCGYSAYYHSALLKHIRTHTGEKPYKCEHCEYSVSQRSHLQRHMLIHTGERPYKCKHCDYSTSRNSDLQRHLRTHTGEKPYKCKHCDFSTSQSSNLKKHNKSIHTRKNKQ